MGPLKPRKRIIVTHIPEHADEMLAEWIFRKYGQRRFAWDERNPLQTLYATSDEEALSFIGGREAECIVIGMLGYDYKGPKDLRVFDEHGKEGRMPNTTSADLVAQYLGVSHLPELKMLLEEIRKADTQPGQQHLELGQLLKVMAGYGTLHVDEMTLFIFAAFDAYHARAVEFNETCASEFQKHGVVETLNGFKIAFVQSDLRSMNGWCRSKKGADIIVQMRQNGSVQMFIRTTERNKAGVCAVARAIVKAEFDHAANLDVELEDLMEQFGKIVTSGKGRDLPGAEHWYYFHEAGQLLNGSTTHPNIRPTELSRFEIARAVRKGLSSIPPLTKTTQ